MTDPVETLVVAPLNPEGNDSSPNLSPNITPVGSSSTPVAEVFLLSVLTKSLLASLTLTDTKNPANGEAWRDCFAGKDVIEWISQTCNLTSESALLLAQSLLDASAFYAKLPAEPTFMDGPDSVYSIWSDDPAEPPSTASAPTGVVTALTPCYSSSCRSGKSCYSPTCMRASWRVEADQESKFLQPAYEQRKKSNFLGKKEKLWSSRAPKELVSSLPAKEVKRQEIIFEFVYTEEDYVEDLEILKKYFLDPIVAGTLQIPQSELFVKNVFGQLIRLHEANKKFLTSLKERQDKDIIVPYIADVFVKHVDSFRVYLEHCPYQKLAIQEVEKQRRTNKDFNTYCEEKERSQICRRLPLQSFLGRPRGRLIKYRLMLETLQKATPEDCPDSRYIVEALDKVKEILTELDKITGYEENKLSLETLNDMIVWKDKEDMMDLQLDAPGRQLLYSGELSKRGTEIGELQVYLFDHLLLLTRKTKKVKEYWDHSLTVHKEPLPLSAILIMNEKEAINHFSVQSDAQKTDNKTLGTHHFTWRGTLKSKTKTMKSGPPSPNPTLAPGAGSSNNLHELSLNSSNSTFVVAYLGKSSRVHILRAKGPSDTAEWLEKLKAAQKAHQERTQVFKSVPLPGSLSIGSTDVRVTCGDCFEGGMILGTESAIYACLSTVGEFVKIVSLEKVSQIRVNAKHGFVAVLGGKQQSVYTFPLEKFKKLLPLTKDDMIEVPDSSGSSLIKFGSSMEKDLLAFVRDKAESVIRSVKLLELEPKKFTKKYKKYNIPSSIASVRFLSKAFVVSTEFGGFQFVDIESCQTQDVLDSSDANLASLNLSTLLPKTLLPVGDNFLACYKELAIFLNKKGQRVNPNFVVNWLGVPISFAMVQKYVLAFNDRFVEIWSLENASLVQVIPGTRLVHLTDNDDDSLNIIIATSTNPGFGAEKFTLTKIAI